MSEKITIEIDDAALDKAIAKIKVALDEKREAEESLDLKDAPKDAPEDEESLDLKDPLEGLEDVDSIAEKISDIEASIQDLDLTVLVSTVEETLERALTAKETAELAKITSETVLADESRLKGLDLVTRRIMSRVPGLRHVQSLVTQIRLMMRLNPEIAALLLAVQVLTWLISERERQREKEEDYEKLISESRGFTQEEYNRWRENDKRIVEEAYKGASP